MNKPYHLYGLSLYRDAMKISDLAISNDIINLLSEQGIDELYPPQEEAIPFVLDHQNVVLSIPTASGKSLVAYLAIVHRLIQESGKALYVVPLKALAREKYEDLKAFERLGLRVGISTGDLDDSDPRLSGYDVIICTSEKADSLLRHGVGWIHQVKVLVLDEIHLIHDPTRGPTLEVIISYFKAMNPVPQIIALSATIQNALDLSLWLEGKLVQSDWRPVPLREGVCLDNHIVFDDGSTRIVDGKRRPPLHMLVDYSARHNGQVLVFVNTRRSTVSTATRLGGIIQEYLSDDDVNKLKDIIMHLDRDQSEHTSIDKQLVSCLQMGTAFHHAGLSTVQRRLVEQGFKQGGIKCLVATPTLAAGVNIPAQRVIIRDLWRYEINFGMSPIPILEYKQQAGRAGRPRYDSFGEAITIAKDEGQRQQIMDTYVRGETEPIYSKLGNQAALRMHLLAAIATGFVDSIETIYSFIDSTFYAYQSEVSTLASAIDETMRFLMDKGFIEGKKQGRFKATLFGKRTSSLYVDPLSAVILKTGLEQSCGRVASPLGLLHIVCSTPDVRSLYLRKSDTWVEELLEHYRSDLLLDVPDIAGEDYEWFLSDLKTAQLLADWIQEISEDGLVTKYNVGPGDIHTIIETARWILHAAREFARMYNFDCVSDVTELVLRVHYGCKKELLNLIQLKGVGRVRARALYNAGYHTIDELRPVPETRLAEIPTIGDRVAKNIKHQIEETSTFRETSLGEFSSLRGYS
jgi:helicase